MSTSVMMGLLPTIAGFGYHEITDQPSTSGFQRPGARPYTLTPRAFAEHLDQMAASETRPMRVTDIDFTLPGRCLVLTFDDGGKSAVHAGDTLARRGWTGHFFIVSSLIGSRTFATASDIRYLASCGHVVGTHTHTHPDIFPDLTPERMLEEWRTSGDAISEILGQPCVTASVPGGDISPEVLESAADAGIRYLFTSEPWLLPRVVRECHVLGRFCSRVGTSPDRIRELAEFRGWTSALVVRRLKVLARAGLPLLYREYVRQTTRAQPEPD
jgi:peptidoglycan/xylan/chitin deacetylase (PgdA/CDA1 family)